MGGIRHMESLLCNCVLGFCGGGFRSFLQFNLVIIFFHAGAGGGKGRSALVEVPKPGSFLFPHADGDVSLLRL